MSASERIRPRACRLPRAAFDPERILSATTTLEFEQIPSSYNFAGERFASFIHEHLIGHSTIPRYEMT